MRKASNNSPALFLLAMAGAVAAPLSCKGADDAADVPSETGGSSRGGSAVTSGGVVSNGGAHASGGANNEGGTTASGGSSSAAGDAALGSAGEVSASGGDSTSGGESASGGAMSESAWPNASNTGVPSGTTLSDYTDDCTISKTGTVVDAKRIQCDLVIRAADVVIKNSKITGLVYLDADQPESKNWSFTLQDSEVDGGSVQRAAVSDGNMTILRANIYGGETSVHCSENALTCRVEDSWLHGQYMPEDVDWHLGGFQSNGGSNIQLVHNTVICDHPVNNVGGGCTGDINLIPDWTTVSHVTIDRNFLGANSDGSYCTYGGEKSTSPYPHADHVVYTNNVFARGNNQKCGAYGPVTGFNVDGTGNVWSNNTWEDGGAVQPEN